MGNYTFSIYHFYLFLIYHLSTTFPQATLELAGACLRADQSVRKRIELENGVSSNEEAIDSLDKQLSESKATLSDSENKFDDISRKLATLEADATRGNERAEGAEKKIADIE